MKTFRNMALYGLMGMLAASCLSNEDPYTAGFQIGKPADGLSRLYANNTADSVLLFSYGDWKMTPYEGYAGSWLKMSATEGKGGYIYGLRADLSQNTTGEPRAALFRLTDTAHPDEASAVFGFWQYATRGDGSLGNAPEVKTIKGSDGSLINIAYDQQHRPTLLQMSKEGTTPTSLSLTYNDRDSLMTVEENGRSMRSYYGNDYQPDALLSETDTLGYTNVFYNYMPIDFRYYFNYEHRRSDAARSTAVRHKFPYQPLVSLEPDSLHCADTLSYFKAKQLQHKLGFEYSAHDNRCQTVDVNQLVLGVEECDPYLLLSLFRYCRSTSIVSRARGEHEDISVTTELNADKSVARMTVDNGTGQITYTFEY